MEGSTNAVIVQGGSSGDGDLVYAVNDTDKTLAEGDKVWLNVVTNDNDHRQRIWSDMYTEKLVYSFGHNLYMSQWKYVWNGSKFESFDYSGADITNIVTPVIRSWGMFFKKNKSVFYPDGHSIVATNGDILNDKYSISSAGICTYDSITGEETVIAERPQTTYTIYYMDDDSDAIMFYTESSKTIDIYDDFRNPSEGHRTFTLQDKAYPMWVTNGLSDNSYFICNLNTVYPQKLSMAAPIVIYKLSNNTLLPATDLPESLQNLMRATNVWATYKDDTKVLTIFRAIDAKILAYKVVDGVFTEVVNDSIILNESPSTSALISYGYFNDDMTQLVVYYKHSSSSYTYNTAYVYHYNVIDGKWHATPHVYNNESTLTGWATGETNENGEVEVKTVLPPEVTMTFNITPDEDTFSYQGITA